MDIIDFRGAIRQEIQDSIKKRKEDFGICPDCLICPQKCKVALAEGLTFFYCRDKINNMEETCE
jgi:hypothetical protein